MPCLDAPLAADKASFSTNLSESDIFLAWKMAESFICSDNFEHRVSIVHLKSCILSGRGLGAVANVVPEMSKELCEITHTRMKTVVATELSIDFQIPRRRGNLRINSPNWKCARAHIHYLENHEIGDFRRYGTAKLLIIVKRNGAGGIPRMLHEVARAMKSGRIERLKIITDEKTAQRDWEINYLTFDRCGVKIKYSEIGLDQLFE
ncbi:hypothetical protein PRIPAC_82430 [Pristionchus pacificus]|uniref:Uncharacterized protein n=1 Tax=Pristionchus pacificus TaxID=54126 RepID=A0A2A6BH94_PRIPA|nr:hypothetical protein PRIPAC_82430 [Pristionchus pacificus]|eukprot:PDM65262.1 hypothetical protein PRIPAC_52204 [Pristionchus pacificus]